MTQSLIYLVVENNIVVNRVVGSHGTIPESWVKETYEVHVGWKYNEELELFTPADMSTSEYNALKESAISSLNAGITKWQPILARTNISEEIKKTISDWLEVQSKELTLIETAKGHLIQNYTFPVDELQPGFDSETIFNIENEV